MLTSSKHLQPLTSATSGARFSQAPHQFGPRQRRRRVPVKSVEEEKRLRAVEGFRTDLRRAEARYLAWTARRAGRLEEAREWSKELR